MTATQSLEALTQPEATRLAHLERAIRAGLSTFMEVGAALLEIRESRLYRQDHRTWGDYTERVWGMSRQRAHQLIEGAQIADTLDVNLGYHPENERQARELKDAAKVIGTLEPEKVIAVAQYLQTATGSERPTTSQVRAAAEVAAAIDAHATVQHPDTGQEVQLHTLTGEQRAAAIAENVSTGTHERLQRQRGHIEASVQAKAAAGTPTWSDWLTTHAAQLPDGQAIQLTVMRDESGNVRHTARVVAYTPATEYAAGDSAPYAKAAVMNLVSEVKGA